MLPTGPILFIDDDEDDQAFYLPILNQLAPRNHVIVLAGAQQTIDYLRVTADKPFLIICELSLPGSSGLELRQQIEDDAALRKRAIPFIFMTHPVYRQQVEAAYNLTIQGLFEKQPNIDATQKQLGSIIQYWQECLHPNRFADSE
jgi:CheY-like chemotaxis protein